MKIGVLSDTHLRSPNARLEHILTVIFADADVILHAGDIVTRKVLERLEESNVLAVCGNMDDYEVAGLLPQVRVFKAGGKQIGLIHGWGRKEALAQRILERFGDRRPDVIVYGHSHVPFWGKVDGTYMFNPGSASHNPYSGSVTVGLLEIDGDFMEGRIIPIES
ncbi:MAG: metallophosphoesterase family protein [Desulfomonilaceae bacterium]|nr:metallophosphoesterase family protein [Desulfomonilaceae bacterium]